MLLISIVIGVNTVLLAIGSISILGMLAVLAATIALTALLASIGAVRAKSWKGTLIGVIVVLIAGVVAVWLQPDQPLYKTLVTVVLVLFNSSILSSVGRRLGR
ncbi:MAG: hypothetical protein OXD31_06185 [Chloroflexi bacterium]|nr:hypothetical protein [Chloroflexota bacterium]